MSDQCLCIQELNEQLKERKVEIAVSILITNEIDPIRPQIRLQSTWESDGRRNIPALTLIASYCPFCGRKYNDVE